MYEIVRLGLVPSTNFGKRRTRILKAALVKVFGKGLNAGTPIAVASPPETQEKWKAI
jgi:hypothetical protein